MPQSDGQLKRERYNEEYCNNLLLGSLKFAPPFLLHRVLNDLADCNRGTKLKERLARISGQEWDGARVDLQPAVLMKEESQKRLLGKSGEGLEADAWFRVGRLVVIVEGEFQKRIDAKQMFRQMAAGLLKKVRPDDLFWVLFNGPHPSNPKLGGRPEKIGLSINARGVIEEVTKRAAGGHSFPELHPLKDHKYVSEHYLWQTWEWLAGRILEHSKDAAASKCLPPHVLSEIECVRGKGWLHYSPKTISHEEDCSHSR